jgi:hypothetical protein
MFNIFGSASSRDYDIMVFVEDIPPINDCKILCAQLEGEFSGIFSDKKCNVNLAIIDSGIIQRVFKGTPDECNNSVYYTYELHTQTHPLPITRTVPRNVELKIARSLRIILSFLSRTEHRVAVKQALRGNIEEKLKVLGSLDLSKIVELGKNNQDIVEFRKQAAFQIAQTLGLMEGWEFYTKEHVSRYLPDLAVYLNRRKAEGDYLEQYKNMLITKINSDYGRLLNAENESSKCFLSNDL